MIAPMARPPIPPDSDWLRQRIVDRTTELGLNAHTLAAKVDAEAVSYHSIVRYLGGQQDMSGRKLQALLDALGLDVRVGDRVSPEWPAKRPKRRDG